MKAQVEELNILKKLIAEGEESFIVYADTEERKEVLELVKEAITNENPTCKTLVIPYEYTLRTKALGLSLKQITDALGIEFDGSGQRLLAEKDIREKFLQKNNQKVKVILNIVEGTSPEGIYCLNTIFRDIEVFGFKMPQIIVLGDTRTKQIRERCKAKIGHPLIARLMLNEVEMREHIKEDKKVKIQKEIVIRKKKKIKIRLNVDDTAGKITMRKEQFGYLTFEEYVLDLIKKDIE